MTVSIAHFEAISFETYLILLQANNKDADQSANHHNQIFVCLI